jgi:hypothetical protein
MNQKSTSNKLAGYLRWMEKICIISLHIGVIFKFFKIGPANDILIISAFGLAIAFFANAFKVPKIFETKEAAEQHGSIGMLDLLSLMIVPKVLWISTSVSTFAMLLYMLKLGNTGYIQMAGIGGGTILVSLLILLSSFFMGIKNMKAIMPILVRAIPALIVDYFLLFQTPTVL